MTKYPTGVEANGNNLRIWFIWQGARRREQLSVPDTPKNRKMAGEFRSNIVYQIKTGTFNYRENFPDSPLFRGEEKEEKKVTIGEIAKKWLKLKETEIAHSTFCTYERRIKVTVGILGADKPVSCIKSEDMMALRNELLTGYQLEGRKHRAIRKGRSVATVNGCMADMRAILNFAQENGYIIKNPMSHISPLRKDRKTPDPLTLEEFPRIIQSCSNRQIANLWSLAVFTGLRHGELCALAWEDIDLEEGYIMVNRNLTNQDRFTPPKTRSSTNRKVCLLEPAISVLRDQMELTRMNRPVSINVETREYDSARPAVCTFVFNAKIFAINDRAGDYYSVASLRQTWTAALRKAGVRHRKAYQSRHTYACWSLAAGANPNYVAAQMGHSDSQMVYRVYGTWMQENNEEQVNLINSKFTGAALHMPYRKTVNA